MTHEAYPLAWPLGRARTPSHRREASAFKTSFAIARDMLRKEVERLGGRNLVISTNIPLRQDGLPYASFRKLDDEGVSIYFTYKGKAMCFACDRWNKVEDNMQAICKTIDALRGIARWGSGDMLEAAFTGFAALAPPSEDWRDVLNVPVGSGNNADQLARARQHYRALASEHHPDRGGSSAMMTKINAAWQKAQEALQA